MGVSLEALIAFLPLAFLLVALLCGCYPGEELALRLARRRPPAPRVSTPVTFSLRERSGVAPALLHLSTCRPLRGPPSLSVTQA